MREGGTGKLSGGSVSDVFRARFSLTMAVARAMASTSGLWIAFGLRPCASSQPAQASRFALGTTTGVMEVEVVRSAGPAEKEDEVDVAVCNVSVIERSDCCEGRCDAHVMPVDERLESRDGLGEKTDNA